MKHQENLFDLHAIFILAFGFAACMIFINEHVFAAQTAKESKTVITTVKKTTDKSAKKENEKKQETKLTVYYFHGYARCISCRKIEQYTKEAAESFASGAYAGRVVFFAVNVEESINAHFIQDYQLAAKAVVLQSEKSGKPGAWENLDRIWLELGNKGKFIAYVKEHIIKQLEVK